MNIYKITATDVNSFGENRSTYPVFFATLKTRKSISGKINKLLPEIKDGCTREFTFKKTGEKTDFPLFIRMYHYDAAALDETGFVFTDDFVNPPDDFGSPCYNWRFIRAIKIDEIMLDELSSDEYTLGCFNASFIAPVFNLPVDAIQILQKNEQFEALGKIMLSNPAAMQRLQRAAAKIDGYGHHFASYDGQTHLCTINGVDYYFFRTN